ncbi:adenine nucleotide alpha hydrolase family protein [Draconibacterium halophilum]|uniref:Universal stress protein n=1 Tax=Draconibacterium halophilum TaxID=2706887 RepID=A0A6C0REE1_9BACT|nr:hypothetical protein [Draconibacterium halophilum]QIA09068.1 hypothetical protein G0Q07_15705 [Draconibacterium halophilum]
MKTLLAIVNAPKESKEFLRYVAGMAVNLAAEVKVLYVHTPPNYPYGLAASVDVASLQVEENLKELIEETDRILEKDIDEITKEIQSPVFTGFSSEIGLTTTVAKKFVSGEKIDMVLLEGQQDYGFWMQSPTNLDVISVLECPVWIIPKGAIYLPFSEIVYATDYNEEDIINLKKLISLFPHLEPNITALHITDSVDFEERVKKEGFLEMLQSKTSYKNLTVKTVHKSKDKETIQLVNDFALSNRADLLVMLKENKSFLERIFTKNQTKETLKTTDLPLLVYHEKE